MTRLRKQIKQAGLRQIDVAHMSGTKYKTLNRQCITGIKTPRIAKRYAPHLHCSWVDLIEDEPTPSKLSKSSN